MEATRRLEIDLPEDLADFVEAGVGTGRFADRSEAVASALTLLREHDEDELEDWVGDEIAAGYDAWRANPSGAIPIEEVSARLDRERKRRSEA